MANCQKVFQMSGIHRTIVWIAAFFFFFYPLVRATAIASGEEYTTVAFGVVQIVGFDQIIQQNRFVVYVAVDVTVATGCIANVVPTLI